MKHKKWLTLLMLLFAPLIAAAQLAQNDSVVAQVPFKFTVGTASIPAGEVAVKLTDQKGWVVTVSNHDTRISVFAPSARGEAKTTAERGALVFHKYGDRYFLVGMRMEDSRRVYNFPQSKLEKELIAQNLNPTEKVLLATK